MRKTLNPVLFLVVILVATQTLLAQQAPLPARLTSAKTAVVINDGTWIKVYDKFYTVLKKWNRFQLVETKEQADIVIVLSTNPGSLVGGMVSSPSGVGVVIGGSASKFYMRITDAKDGTPLWADSTGEAFFLVSNSAKKFIKRLRKRFVGVPYTKPPK